MAQLPIDLWENGLADLFKQVVADMTLVDQPENGITSLLETLLEKDDSDVLVEMDDFISALLPIGCLHHSVRSTFISFLKI